MKGAGLEPFNEILNLCEDLWVYIVYAWIVRGKVDEYPQVFSNEDLGDKI